MFQKTYCNICKVFIKKDSTDAKRFEDGVYCGSCADYKQQTAIAKYRQENGI